MDKLAQSMARNDSRLTSLVGPGGIGKSRTAKLIADQFSALFVDRSINVDTTGVANTTQLDIRIAGALRFDFYADEKSHSQLCDFLSGKEMLIALDPLDELLDSIGADALNEHLLSLRRAAPALMLMVSSRSAVKHFRGETFRLAGLQRADAETLFSNRASRLNAAISTKDAAFQGSFKRIWELTGGNPLAIELAAGWARSLSPEEIADEIARDHTFLRGQPGSDVQPGLPAVFETSWRRLRATERRILGMLSILPSDFTAEHALAVAQARTRQLDGLVTRSVLSSDSNGLYRIHPPFRQFCLDKTDSQTRRAAREQLVQLAAIICSQIAEDFARNEQLRGLQKVRK